MSTKTKNQVTLYKVLSPFRYPVNGVIRWVMTGEKVELPQHAADALIRQLKIEVIL